MARGITPRMPAKKGRQEGTKSKAALVKQSADRGRVGIKPAKAAGPQSSSKLGKASRPARGYRPTAPERVAEILKRLDQTYPDVTCALTHRTPWELLVATILSAQSTDVR